MLHSEGQDYVQFLAGRSYQLSGNLNSFRLTAWLKLNGSSPPWAKNHTINRFSHVVCARKPSPELATELHYSLHFLANEITHLAQYLGKRCEG